MRDWCCLLDGLEPGVLARRLVEMSVNANVPLQWLLPASQQDERAPRERHAELAVGSDSLRDTRAGAPPASRSRIANDCPIAARDGERRLDRTLAEMEIRSLRVHRRRTAPGLARARGRSRANHARADGASDQLGVEFAERALLIDHPLSGVSFDRETSPRSEDRASSPPWLSKNAANSRRRPRGPRGPGPRRRATTK